MQGSQRTPGPWAGRCTWDPSIQESPLAVQQVYAGTTGHQSMCCDPPEIPSTTPESASDSVPRSQRLWPARVNRQEPAWPPLSPRTRCWDLRKNGPARAVATQREASLRICLDNGRIHRVFGRRGCFQPPEVNAALVVLQSSWFQPMAGSLYVGIYFQSGRSLGITASHPEEAKGPICTKSGRCACRAFILLCKSECTASTHSPRIGTSGRFARIRSTL